MDWVPGAERFHKLNIRLVKVREPVTSGKYQWRESFTKLRVAELFDYERVIYFDVDSYLLGTVDFLFDVANFPTAIAAPRAYWFSDATYRNP